MERPSAARPAAGRKRQRGAVAIITGLSLVVLLGVSAFAIDIGRLLVVKNELHNAADASALAGAGWLLPPVGGGPNWQQAVEKGRAAISMNRSDGATLSSASVVPGWWNMSTYTLDTDTARAPGASDLPAVRAHVVRKDGENAGAVGTIFARIFGVDGLQAGATATAVVSMPTNAGLGALAPMALSSCLTTPAAGFWDAATNGPVNGPDGLPQKFVVGSGAASGNSCNGCSCGQWTTFENELNNVPSVRTLIENGNTAPLAVGDEVWIQPGTSATLYDDADSKFSGKKLIFPIVEPVDASEGDVDLSKKGEAKIKSWGCVFVHDVIKTQGTCTYYGGSSTPLPGGNLNKGQDKTCMVVSFDTGCAMPGAAGGGTGPYQGVHVPPRLVQ